MYFEQVSVIVDGRTGQGDNNNSNTKHHDAGNDVNDNDNGGALNGITTAQHRQHQH